MPNATFTVSLSFDNGPVPEVTPAVLDLLARHGIRASFFVIGRRAVEHPELLARAHAEGHWLGNHTWSHGVPLGHQTGPDVALEEVERLQTLIGPLAHPRKFFRPFGSGGLLDPRLFRSDVIDYLSREQFTCVLWNSIPRDWADPEGWPETALQQCRAQAESLVVVHDAANGAMAHLERFILAVREQGGRFVQEFPKQTIIMERGAAKPGLEQYVTNYPGEAG